MKYAIAFLLLTVVFVSGCKKPKDGNFTLQLKAKYGDQSFALNYPNTDPLGRRIQIAGLKFYLSHIKLIKNDNSELELKDAVLYDLSNPNSLSFNISGVNGDFKAVKFSCGVDSVQNLTDPNSISDDNNPFSNASGMYWTWLKYQFETLDASADTTTTGSGPFNWYPGYHIGGNSLYRTTQLTKSFSVCCDNKYTMNLVLDVKKIFFGGTQTLDIITERNTQSGASDNPVIAPKFADNFSQAFSIE